MKKGGNLVFLFFYLLNVEKLITQSILSIFPEFKLIQLAIDMKNIMHIKSRVFENHFSMKHGKLSFNYFCIFFTNLAVIHIGCKTGNFWVTKNHVVVNHQHQSKINRELVIFNKIKANIVFFTNLYQHNRHVTTKLGVVRTAMTSASLKVSVYCNPTGTSRDIEKIHYLNTIFYAK